MGTVSDFSGPACDGTTGPGRCAAGLVMRWKLAALDMQYRRIGLLQQLVIMGRQQNRGAQPVQFNEQVQETSRQRRVDIAGRLVGEQQFRLADYRARDGGTLFFAARQDRRIGASLIGQPHPAQQVHDIGAVICLAFSGDSQRQRHIVVGCQMIEQAELLEHHADAAAQMRQAAAPQGQHIFAKEPD